MIALGILAALAVVLLGAKSAAAPAAAPKGFPDGGAFYARYMADHLASGAPGWLDPRMSYIIAEIETDFGTSAALAASRSYFNRHEGSGAGEWLHQLHTTSRGEQIRKYADRRQGVRDFAQLVSGSKIYAQAYAAMLRKDWRAFFGALVRGDGREGYVGDPNAQKGRDYLAAVLRRYQARFA